MGPVADPVADRAEGADDFSISASVVACSSAERQSALPRSSWPVVTGAHRQQWLWLVTIRSNVLPAGAVGTRALGISFHTSGASTILALALVPHTGVRGWVFSLPEQKGA
jgi:hypothetical protein